jgi:hypothetical protein
MAATPPSPQKVRMDFNLDKSTYEAFAKLCSRKGFATQIVLEKLMKKFNETGQM